MELDGLQQGAIGQFETEIRAERQAEGIHKAKARGVKIGRSKHLNDNEVSDLKKKREEGVTVKQLMLDYGLGKTTVYRYLAQ